MHDVHPNFALESDRSTAKHIGLDKVRPVKRFWIAELWFRITK